MAPRCRTYALLRCRVVEEPEEGGKTVYEILDAWTDAEEEVAPTSHKHAANLHDHADLHDL
jgi:hypothetical protein